MRIKFSKRQKATMLTLYAVAGILLCGIFFLPWVNPAANGGETPGGDVPAEAQPHDRYRLPRYLAFDESIVWETNLGGSGTEEVLAAYPTLSGILIFGNTDSTDYDFADNETPSYFTVLLGTNGQPIHYRCAPGTLSAVEPVSATETMIDGGFLLCVNTQTEGILIKTDALGIEIARTVLALSQHRERLIAAYEDFFVSPENEPYHAVVECVDETSRITTLKIHILNPNLEEQHFRYFPRAQNMSYVAAYSYPGGFYLFANIVSDRSAILAYYTWNASVDSKDYTLNLSLINNYITDAVVPNGTGRYALLIRETSRSIPYLIDCTQNFSAKPAVHELSNAPAEKTALVSSGHHLFAYLYSVGDISEVFCVSADYSLKTELEGLSRLNTFYCHTETPSGTLLCGQTANAILITGVGENSGYFEEILSQTASVKSAVYTDDGNLILIGTSYSKSLNIGGHFGKDDIWICKVTL